VTHVFHRRIADRLAVADHGDGVYIVDRHGRRYLDASGGAAVSSLGHSHPAVIDAIRAQVGRLAFAHTAFFTSDPMEELADLLAEGAPGDLDMVWYVSGGSEATEAALKLARQYFVETGEPARRYVIARRQSYHGNTLGALSAGGNVGRRAPFEPILIESVRHIPACYAYRERRHDETEEDYGCRVADALEAQILELGADNVAAFIAEPVVGATLGAVPAVDGYFRRIREICDRHGVLLILDEVMCGMGRTGALFACELDGVAPDLLALAKGLGAGYQPIGAVMVSRRIYDAIADGSGAFVHGHTYMGHATACAAATAVQRTIRADGFMASIAAKGRLLEDALQDRFGNHPHVGDIRGRGLLIGLELVADRGTKAPFDPTAGVHRTIKREALDRGLICYPGGGTADGRSGDHVLLAPPFIVEPHHIEELIDKLGGAVDAAIASCGAAP
jgi:adenosylmethionine-8-amino-7-oxononanoate aminotransferase